MSKITVRKAEAPATPTPQPLTFDDLEAGEAFFWNFDDYRNATLRIKTLTSRGYEAVQPSAGRSWEVTGGQVVRAKATLTWKVAE